MQRAPSDLASIPTFTRCFIDGVMCVPTTTLTLRRCFFPSNRSRNMMCRASDEGVQWTNKLVATLAGAPAAPKRTVHPGVRKVLRLLQSNPELETSLEALATSVGLSPGRLMHAFTSGAGPARRASVIR